MNKNVELRLWRQFATLADELHFGRAAQRLHMTQPPLTQAIAHLEQLLEVRLFDRTKRSVRLTKAGDAILPEVRDLILRADGLPHRARAAAAGEVGRLRLAFVSTAGFALLPRWVRAFRDRYPEVGLELLEATGDMQLKAFDRQEIDAGIMLHAPGFEPVGLERRPVALEPFVLAVPEQNPLASARLLRLERVLAESLVVFPRRILPSLHDAVMGIYHAAGLSPVVAQEAIQMQTIVNLVSAGLGVAWVPQSVTQFQRSGVVYRTLSAKQGISAPLCETSLVWPTGPANPCVQRFLEVALAQ
ncbi:MAG: LysR family transcriptional regulator [Pseudomonadota bacterium]